MTYLVALKSLLIFLTGVFGIAGLVQDFRDRQSQEVTTWGKISLAGIVVSTSLGLIIQIQESMEQAKQAAETSQSILHIVKNTENSVRDLRRALSPLGFGEMWVELSGDCGELPFKESCQGIVTSNNRPMRTNDAENERWSRSEIDIFDGESQATSFCKDDTPPILSAAFISEHNATKGPVLRNSIAYRVRFEMKKSGMYSNGEILSILDLKQKWFAYFDDGLDKYKINNLAVHTTGGEFVTLFDREAGVEIKDCLDKYAKRRRYTHAAYGQLPN